MNTQTTIEKLNKEIKAVKREVDILRSFAISIAGKDPEGEYRSEFVREILHASTRTASESPEYKEYSVRYTLYSSQRGWSFFICVLVPQLKNWYN